MVPNGWEKVSLGEVFDFRNGINADKSQYGQGVKFVNVMDVFGNDVLTEPKIIGRISISEKKLDDNRLEYGDVLFNRTSETFDEIAMSAVYLDSADATFGGFVIRGRPLTNSLDPKYTVYAFQDSNFRKQVIQLGQGAVRANIGQKDLVKVELLVPPLPEQKKIAKFLSTWDKAISTTERLIENSTQQKKALMQQLLMGKKRFGYKDITYSFQKTRYGDIPLDWEYPAIKDVSVQLSKKNTDGKDYPVVSCSKHYGFVDSLDYFKKKVYSDDTSGYRIIPRNAFGFPSNHIEEGSIGVQTVHDIAIASPIYVVFKANPKLINNVYLYALLKTEHYRQIFCAATNASVDRRGSLRWKEFSAIRIPLPPLEEQQKVATVLTNADKEIELLEQQLANLQQEKKALMQVLLTGKKRVVVDGEDV